MRDKTQNGQSAAKSLIINLDGKGSTTIPRKGSTLEKFLAEKPDTKFKKLFSRFSTKKFNKPGIYGIFTLHNKKVYIGRTISFQRRFRKHREAFVNNKHHNIYLQRVFNKYGKDNFFIFLIDSKNCEKLELAYIKKFDSVNKGYNLTYDTQKQFLDRKHIENNIKRTSKPVIALTLKGEFYKEFSSVSNAARYFKTSSSNISGVCKGNLRYIKNKIFVYKKDYDPKKKYFVRSIDYSYKKTREYKEKISKALKGRKVSKESRQKSAMAQGHCVYCETDKKKFYSMAEAGRYYNIYSGSIKRAIKQKRPCKGLFFKFCKDIV